MCRTKLGSTTYIGIGGKASQTADSADQQDRSEASAIHEKQRRCQGDRQTGSDSHQ